MSFRKGSKVWVGDKDLAWVMAEVVDVSGKQVRLVTASGRKLLITSDQLLPRDPDADHDGVDDMTKLTYLNEPGVLYNLARRYALNDIYTAFYALKRLQTKKQKTVERHASKSRKIRYHVHEKIVNFMAPEPMNMPPMAPKLFEYLFGLKNQQSASVV